MRRGPTIALAFATGLIAWPWLMISEAEKRLPDMSCPAVVEAWARVSEWASWFHDLKNLGTELFRCDAQWWFKFSAWMISTETIALVLALCVVAILSVRVAHKGA